MKTVYGLLLVQGIITLILTLLWAGFSGYHAGYSSILGGLAAIIPNMIFAARLFKYRGAQAAGKIVKSFYQAEMLKIAVTVVLFTVFIIYLQGQFLPLMGTYIFCQLTFWLGLLITP